MLGRLRLGLPIRKCSSECIRVVFLVTLSLFPEGTQRVRGMAQSQWLCQGRPPGTGKLNRNMVSGHASFASWMGRDDDNM